MPATTASREERSGVRDHASHAAALQRNEVKWSWAVPIDVADVHTLAVTVTSSGTASIAFSAPSVLICCSTSTESASSETTTLCDRGCA